MVFVQNVLHVFSQSNTIACDYLIKKKVEKGDFCCIWCVDWDVTEVVSPYLKTLQRGKKKNLKAYCCSIYTPVIQNYTVRDEITVAVILHNSSANDCSNICLRGTLSEVP